jgi:signal transduction histidine kinase
MGSCAPDTYGDGMTTIRAGRATLSAVVAMLLSGIVIGIIGIIGVVAEAAIWSLATGPGDLAHYVVYAAFVLAAPVLLLWAVQGFADVQRARLHAVLAADIAKPTTDNRWWPFGPWRSATTWRAFGYHLASVLVGGLAGAAVLTCWTAPILTFLWLWDQDTPDWVLALAIAGSANLVLVAPRLSRMVTRWDLRVARALLGPSRGDELAQQVAALARSRADIVAATDAERRRIERDLHDGTQQRLVSLAMNLGVAQARIADAPEPARQAIAEAHEEALQALVDLRALVRGLHPAVLNDRGLDAALSGLAARSPIPVRLTVDVPARCSPSVEAVAYFIVSESLANVVKHANATRVDVTVARNGDLLHVVVVDDGRGGAVPTSDGIGLPGLAQRAAAVDGTLTVTSPNGGPTTVTAELPCES